MEADDLVPCAAAVPHVVRVLGAGMNRRGFLLGLATAALCATTRLYGLASLPILQDITLAEWATWRDPQGDIAKIADYLQESNEILDDAVFVSRQPTYGVSPMEKALRDIVTIKTKLPEVAWEG